MASYLDFTNPVAYDFWMGCVRRQLVEKGYRSIWNDNNEYDVWDKDVYACGFGQEVPARQIRPLFAYLMSRASREASLFSGGYRKGEVPFIISRAAMPGMQRVATTWTGDNYTSFRELRFNHRQAMTMALSGFAFFGQDIVRSRSCFCAGCSTASLCRASCCIPGKRASRPPCPGSTPS